MNQSARVLAPVSEAKGAQVPTMNESTPFAIQRHPAEHATDCKEHIGAVAPSTQEYEGAARPYGKTLLTSFTVLKPHTLTGLSDDELQRYIDGVSDRMEAAHAEWLKSDCFGALGERDRLWLALQAALCERGTRPHLVAARIAEIDAAIALSAGAEQE